MTRDECQQGNKEKKGSEVGVFIASVLSEGLVTANIRYLSSGSSSLYSDNTSFSCPFRSLLVKIPPQSEHILLVDVTDLDMKSKITY